MLYCSPPYAATGGRFILVIYVTGKPGLTLAVSSAFWPAAVASVADISTRSRRFGPHLGHSDNSRAKKKSWNHEIKVTIWAKSFLPDKLQGHKWARCRVHYCDLDDLAGWLKTRVQEVPSSRLRPRLLDNWHNSTSNWPPRSRWMELAEVVAHGQTILPAGGLPTAGGRRYNLSSFQRNIL